jgi:hypothetical protein
MELPVLFFINLSCSIKDGFRKKRENSNCYTEFLRNYTCEIVALMIEYPSVAYKCL